MKSIKSLTVTALALCLAAMLGTHPAAAQEYELLQPGELSVATEGTYPPFSMQNDKNELDGLEIGVMREVAKRIGLTYKPVLIKWDSILIGLLSDQYDVISAAMDITGERQQKIIFSNGWLESGGRLIVRKDSGIDSTAGINGKAVGVLVASTWVDLAKKLGAADIKTYKAETDALQDLVNGNIDGVVTDAIAGAYAIKTSNLPLSMVDEPLSSIQKGFAFKKGKPNLVKAVNKALADMVADGTYAKLTTDLIGFSPAPKSPIPSQL